jgi:hypothetical protein
LRTIPFFSRLVAKAAYLVTKKPPLGKFRLIAELEKQIRDEKIGKYSTEQIAKFAELESYYDTLYGFFSMAVHSSSRSLDKALQTDGKGRVTSVEYGPALDGFDMHFDYEISMTLYVLHEISVHFKKDTAEVEALQKKNQELAGEAQQAVAADRPKTESS